MRIHNLYTDASGNRISATSKSSGSRSGEAASFPSACRPPGSSSARPKLNTTSIGTRHRAGNTSSISMPG